MNSRDKAIQTLTGIALIAIAVFVSGCNTSNDTNSAETKQNAEKQWNETKKQLKELIADTEADLERLNVRLLDLDRKEAKETLTEKELKTRERLHEIKADLRVKLNQAKAELHSDFSRAKSSTKNEINELRVELAEWLERTADKIDR